MKVYELMKLLEDQPAGREVLVNVSGTLNAEVVQACDDGEGYFVIEGAAVEVVGTDGDIVGWSNEIDPPATRT